MCEASDHLITGRKLFLVLHLPVDFLFYLLPPEDLGIYATHYNQVGRQDNLYQLTCELSGDDNQQAEKLSLLSLCSYYINHL